MENQQNANTNEVLTEEEIHMLLDTCDEVLPEYESPLRLSLLAFRKLIEQYDNLLYNIEKLSPVEHSSFIIEGEVEEPYWQDTLSSEQQNQFDTYLAELIKLPALIRAESDNAERLALAAHTDGALTKDQLGLCNYLYRRLAETIIRHYALPEKLHTLPAVALEQVCAVRSCVLLSVRRFFMRMFSLGGKNPLYKFQELHTAWQKASAESARNFLSDLGSAEEFDAGSLPPPEGSGKLASFAQMAVQGALDDEKIWQRFFEARNTSVYADYYARTLLSLNTVALHLSADKGQYLAEIGAETLSELCALPYEKLPLLDASFGEAGFTGAADDISARLSVLGLCFETAYEDVLAVCSEPLVLRHYGGAGFGELYHERDMLGLREVIRSTKSRVAARSTAVTLSEDAAASFSDETVLSIGGVLMQVRGERQTFTVPDDCTEIASTAFTGSDRLEKITIGAGVYRIGAFAFTLPALKALSYAGSVDEWNAVEKDPLWNYGINVSVVHCTDGEAPCALCIQDDCVLSCAIEAVRADIPAGCIEIAPRAFEGCAKLTSVYIPDSVQAVGERAFMGCAALTAVAIPEGITVLNPYTFAHCTSLVSCTLPDRLETIAGYAFYDCTALSVFEPGPYSKLRSIGYGAFLECTVLSHVCIPPLVTAIGQDAFYICPLENGIDVAPENTAYASEGGILYNKAKTTLIRCPIVSKKYVTVQIPDTVTALAKNAFAGCLLLEHITVPSGVRHIPDSAFSDCEHLSDVTISDGLELIESAAFIRCKSLHSITLPKTVKKIESMAFYDCASLSEIRFCGTVAEWESVKRISGYTENCPVSSVSCTDGTAELGADKEDWELSEEDMQKIEKLAAEPEKKLGDS